MRARAETLIPSCKVGFLERAERTVTLFVGALVGNLHLAALLIAVLGNWAAIERILYTKVVLADPSRPVTAWFWRHDRLSLPHATLSAILIAFLLFGHHLIPRP